MPVRQRDMRRAQKSVLNNLPRAQLCPALELTGSCDVNHVEVVLVDHAIQVHVDEVETGHGSEMAEQTRLDVLCLEFLLQQRIRKQVDLANREIVGSL